jgi:hypothetical protein
MAFTSKIPSSQTKATSLCCYNFSLFIATVATWRYGCNPNLKIIFKKLLVVFCWSLLANFNNIS